MSLWTLVRRSLARHPFRTVSTVLGVAIPVIAFVALRTVIDAWSAGAQYAAQDRLTTRHKVSYGLPLPKRYVEDIATHVPGVKQVAYCDWFGGRWAKAPNEFFANLACSNDAFAVYPEMQVDPAALEAWKRDKQGAIIGDLLAQRFGLAVGDRMTLRGSFHPGDWELRIAGIYTAPPRAPVDRTSLFFHWDYKNEGVPPHQRDKIGWVFTRVDDPRSSAQVSRAIDALFDDREIRTATMSERAANSTLLGGVTAVLSAIDVVSILVLAIMTLMLGNTIAMVVRDQTAEYATLLAIGFEPRHVRGLVFAHAMSLSLCGGLLGLALAYPIVQLGLGQWLEVNVGKFFPSFRIALHTLIAAPALSLAVGALAAWLPALRIGRLPAIELMRGAR